MRTRPHNNKLHIMAKADVKYRIDGVLKVLGSAQEVKWRRVMWIRNAGGQRGFEK